MPICSTCNQQKKGRLDTNGVCRECRENASASAGAEDIPPLPDDWMTTPISTLLGGHLLQVINNNMKPIRDMLEDQKKHIKSLEDSNKKLEGDNKDLKQRLKIAETKIKNLETTEAKVKTVVTRQQAYIAKQDKMCRLKNVLIGGLSEVDALQHNNEVADTDKDKVDLILSAIGQSTISIAHCRRVGTEDQGHEGRGRFLLVEFLNQNDRNAVRAASSQLSNFEHLKNIRIKADLTKEERDEYKRLYASKDTLAANHPNEDVRVDKGKLYVGNNVVDQINTATKIF